MLLVSFADGTQLAFVNTRRIGRIWWFPSKNAEEEEPVCHLAEDAYASKISATSFVECIRERDNKVLKSVLMDQQAVMCGIGNWIVDEVCHHARVDPATKCASLSDERLHMILESIRYVVTEACKVRADSTKFPPEWVFHKRWEKRSAKKRRLTVQDDKGKQHTIKFKTVGGRTTAFVPTLLRKKP